MSDTNALVDGFDPKDEPLPFLSNFQDFFLSIGVIILLVGLAIFGGLITASIPAEGRQYALVGIGICSVFLLIVWFLSEILVRARRRILPGIVLCIAFLSLAVAIYVLAYGFAFGDNVVEQLKATDWNIVDEIEQGEPTSHEVLRSYAAAAVGALPMAAKAFIVTLPIAAMLGGLVYYRRFKLPFASALVGVAAIGVVVAPLTLLFPYDVVRFYPTITFLSGLALLIAAVGYDMRDPERVSRFSGNGFWLHFVAAPMILSGALAITSIGFGYDFPNYAEGNFDRLTNQFSVQQSVVTLVVIGVFAIISLLLNRRALVVSGLVSAGIAIGVIVNATGVGGMGVAATTLVVLGAAILLLGIGWQAARRALLALVPSGGMFGRMFPRNDVDG